MRIKLNGTKWDIEQIDQKHLFIVYAISTNTKGQEVRTKHLNYATMKRVKIYLMQYTMCEVNKVNEALKGLEYE